MKLIDIQEVLTENFMQYATYTITNRAITSIEDGLKDVHRRLLWTMYSDRIFNFTKSANITGATMLIHAHGDTYPSLVRMAQTDTHNHCFVEGKGNFSQHTSRDLQAAASRYTEVKLTKYAQECLEGLKENQVGFVENYDNTKKIPEYMPFPIPNILLTNNQGIATGMSSNICSFNLRELVDACCIYITSGEKTDLYPDFPTKGSIIKNGQEIAKINATGTGVLRLRGTHHVKGREVIITEIPFTTTREDIIDKVIELTKSGSMNEVYNITDTTDLAGMKITVELKRGADVDLFINKLYSKTTMQTTFSANFTVLVNGNPKVLGVWSIIDEWLNIRRKQIKNSIEFKIEHLTKELEIMYGLKKVLSNVDATIDIIRNTPEASMVNKLKEFFDINNKQAEMIVNMPLKKISRDSISQKIKDVDNIELEIDKLQSQLSSDKKINAIIIKQMKKIADKYGSDRKSILQEEEVDLKKVDALIKESIIYEVVVTKGNYIKKVSPKDRATNKLKDGDRVILQERFNALSDVLVFTDANKCYKLPLLRIGECKLNTLGNSLYNLLDINPKHESIIKVIVTQDYTGELFVVYNNNKAAKIDLNSYKINRKIITPAYSELASIIDIFEIKQEKEVCYYTSKGKSKILSLSDFALNKSRISQGKLLFSNKDNIKSIELR